MTRLVLHMGLTKTGTSTLQQSIFPRHPEIFYLGKYLKSDVARGCRNDEVYEIVDSLLWNPPEPGADRAAIKQLYNARIESELRKHKVVIGSWETNANMSDKKLGQVISMAQYLAGDCGALYTLRNPVTWLTSEYLQRVQGQYYRKNREQQFRGKPWIPFNEWLAVKDQAAFGLSGLFRCATNIRGAADTLGREGVGVFIFEQLCADPEAYYGQVADWLGVEQPTFQRLARGSHSNRGLRQSEYERIQQVAASQELSERWSKMSYAERVDDMRQYLGKGFEQGEGARVSLGEELRTYVEQTTSEPLRWVAQQYDLPLEHYGYSV